jgi:Virulence-associated protein E/Bifunctional DNA primase/polymerase, N-terminal
MMSPLGIAVSYLHRGWSPIPVPHKSKRPLGDEWQNLRIAEGFARQWFNGEAQNVGVLLGAPSAGLTDGDLDCQEAIVAAAYLMPKTDAIFGRASKRASHRLYKTTLCESQGKATIQFKDTQKPAKVILEFRVGADAAGDHAAQTIAPGSVHPSGELITWEDDGEPAAVDDVALLAAGARVAACVLLGRAYPRQGGRHEGALIVAGFLCRCGFAAPDIKLFVDALAGVTCQPPDKRNDMVRAAGDTAEAFVAGRNTCGLPKLIEVFGEPVAKKCVQWLGYRTEARGANGERAAEARAADRFVRGDAGQILRGHPGNIRAAVEQLGVSLRLNEFSSQTDLAGLAGHGPWLNDAAGDRLRILIHDTYGFLPSKELFESVINDIAHANRFHPVREYLDRLAWDRRERLKIWLANYLGTDQTPYAEGIGRAFFIALVARIFRPGCKQDYMLILEGPQGALKSMACEVIAGNWFSDNLPDVRDSKDLSQHLQGKWLIEIGELSALGRAETTTLKAFITRRTERYRPSYGRREVIQPRQCVFVGTTNADCYLKDATGGRRFWPVKVNYIDLEALRADRDQLFAEAVHLFKAGAKWWPDRDFEANHIKPEQDARYVDDPWQEKIAEHIEGLSRVTVGMVAKDALFIETARISMRDSYRIIDVLTSLGWTMTRSNGVRWYKPRNSAA